MRRLLAIAFSLFFIIFVISALKSVNAAELNLDVNLDCVGREGDQKCLCVQRCINEINGPNGSKRFLDAMSSSANNFQLQCADNDLQAYVNAHRSTAYEDVLNGIENGSSVCTDGISDIASRNIGVWCNATPYSCNLSAEELAHSAQELAVKALTTNRITIENLATTPTPLVIASGVPTPTPLQGEYTPTEWFVETDGEMQSYGDSCGLAGVAGKDMCCLSQVPSIRFNAPSGFAQVLLGTVQASVNFLVDKVNLVSKTGTMAMYDMSTTVKSQYNPFCYTGKPSSYKSGGTQNPFTDLNCTCEEATIGSGGTPNEAICNMIDPVKYSKENAECIACYTGGGGVWTALGCVETDFGTFITKTVFGTGISIAGLVALLCIIYSSFLMQTSKGNPEQITKAQEMLTSCITGLIMIIFSVLILRFIGVDLLRIPGFAGSDSTIASSVTPTPGSGIEMVVSAPTSAVATTPVLTIKPTLTKTPSALVSQTPTPTPLVGTTSTVTPAPTNTPVPIPTIARNPVLGEFDCDSTNEPLANEVYLYDDTNFTGACLRVTLGKYGLQTVKNKLTQSGVANWGWTCRSSFNDCINSLKVGSGVIIDLYQDPIATSIPDSGACRVSTQSDMSDLNKVQGVNCNSGGLFLNGRSDFIGDNVSYIVVQEK